MADLLAICQSVADLMSVRRPTTVASPAVEADRIWLHLAVECNRLLADSGDWWELAKKGSITLATGQEGYSLSSDFWRFVPDTMYKPDDGDQQMFPVSRANYSSVQWGNNERSRPFIGILTYRTSGSSGNADVRSVGPQILLQPTPTADVNGLVLRYWYVVNTLAMTSGLVVKENFTADTDVPILPEHLLKLAMIWRYKQTQGFDYGTDQAIYERELERVLGFNNAARALNLANEPVFRDRAFVGLTIKDRGYG